MEIPLKYGGATVCLRLPETGGGVAVLRPGRTGGQADEDSQILTALARPLGSPRLAERVAPGQKVAVVTSDVTRPCPSARLLPPVLAELNQAGIPDADITVIFGLGTHRAHREAEQRTLVGEAIFQRVRCLDTDPREAEWIGTTRRGTPVEVFRPVLAADARVLLGVIEYHYFAGYSGGVKALVPGACTRATIQHNHRMMTEAGAAAGRLEGNPVREDIEEAGHLVGADFLLNVVLDEQKRIVRAVAGDPVLAHRAGCRALDAFGRAEVDRPADVVVVSAGGAPKDINLYQAQKALDNARHIVRPGGIIVVLAECPDGLGDSTFEVWMQDPGGAEAILARIRQEFVLGGHKAAAVALAMQQAAIYLVSALPPGLVRGMGFQPFSSLAEAVQAALETAGASAFVAVMPEGGSTLPSLVSRAGSR